MTRGRKLILPRRVRAAFWLAIVLGLLATAAANGCGNPRVVVVPETEPRQLAESVKAYVYVGTEAGRQKSANRVQLHEGEWVLSDPGPTETAATGSDGDPK